VERLRDTSDHFIRPQIQTPQQPQGNVAKVALFPNGPRRVANAARDRERIAQSEVTIDYNRSVEAERRARQAEEHKRDARQADSRRLSHSEQERERSRQAQFLQHYDSVAEKRFREEAEQVHGREPNRELLAEWLEWKTEELRIRAGALRQRAADHRSEAATNREYAANVRENARIHEKTGSDESAEMNRNRGLELDEKAEAHEKLAAAFEDQAEDSQLACEYYANFRSDTALSVESIADARSFGRSFQDSVEKGFAPILSRAHSRRRMARFRAACWKWARRVAITLAILFLLGLLGKLQGN
jgi:hypothetical protein